MDISTPNSTIYDNQDVTYHFVELFFIYNLSC